MLIFWKRPKTYFFLTSQKPWASADFFPGEGKNFPGGVGEQEPIFCLKNKEKDTIFPKKV